MNLFNLKEKKEILLKKENIFFLIIITIIFVLDRYSKFNVIKNFNERTYFVNDYINLDLIWNIGIGFGLLSTDSNLFYSLITFLISFVIIFLIYISFSANMSISLFIQSL